MPYEQVADFPIHDKSTVFENFDVIVTNKDRIYQHDHAESLYNLIPRDFCSLGGISRQSTVVLAHYNPNKIDSIVEA
jgi:hypothetical protein